MKLPPDWSEFIASLNRHGVRYLIVGAHAVAANGRPRATQDIDFWVEPTAANAARLGQALVDFGFADLAAMESEFTIPDKMVTLGRPPLRIDIMTSISGVEFEDAWAGRVTAAFGQYEVPFLGLEHLLANKRAAGRPKDLLDVELLLESDS